jgi:hypothetical protein
MNWGAMKDIPLSLIAIAIYLGVFLLLQVYTGYRIKKMRRMHKGDRDKKADEQLTPKEAFRFGAIHVLMQCYFIGWSIYFVAAEGLPIYYGIAMIAFAISLIRKPLQWVRGNWPVYPERTVPLNITIPHTADITPEMILNILDTEPVRSTIKNDLEKTDQIRHKEQWRLGVVTPQNDTYDVSIFQESRKERLSRGFTAAAILNAQSKVPITRWAVLFGTALFRIPMNNLLIVNGIRPPFIRSYPGWSFSLKTRIPRNGYAPIRKLEVQSGSYSMVNRSTGIVAFLREDGFPVRETYVDGDPMTAERGGTIVLDRGKVKVIYRKYFIQSRLIDDEGNLLYMGLEDDFPPSAAWNGFSVKPSASKYLYQCVKYNEFVPVVRYRSFPVISSIMLPVIDTPMSDNGWADVFINRQGRGQLYVAKERTLEQWSEMMEKLRCLFFDAVIKNGYHLLKFTKNRLHVQEYMMQKQRILHDYFEIIDWSLF